MATATSSPAQTNWRDEWFEFEDATYLNVAGNAPMPKASLKAAQAAIEWKKFPQRVPDEAYFDVPNRTAFTANFGRIFSAEPARQINRLPGADAVLSAARHRHPAHRAAIAAEQGRGLRRLSATHQRVRALVPETPLAPAGALA